MEKFWESRGGVGKSGMLEHKSSNISETVRLSIKLSEGANRKPGSNSCFFGSPPYFYFWFRLYGHRDGRFCLIFARTAQRSVLDGRNGLSSSKPCAHCWIVR